MEDDHSPTNMTTGSTDFGVHDRFEPEKVAVEGYIEAGMSNFWEKKKNEVVELDPYNDNMFHYCMPLARIKKIVKLDPKINMLGTDVPVVLAKAIELFIGELSMRAWLDAAQQRKKTIKFQNIASAIPLCKEFDFLIDIVPRQTGGFDSSGRGYGAGMGDYIPAGMPGLPYPQRNEAAHGNSTTTSLNTMLKSVDVQTLRLPPLGSTVLDTGMKQIEQFLNVANGRQRTESMENGFGESQLKLPDLGSNKKRKVDEQEIKLEVLKGLEDLIRTLKTDEAAKKVPVENFPAIFSLFSSYFYDMQCRT
eukprot:maker-scaffold_25-snap-gene-0.39-mRNA-1 protein AED:0.00 eAED:0.00 QI:103/1/1/1/1/1/2/45/305